MLKLNLTHLFALRRIKKPYTYLRSLGFSHDVAHRLISHKAKGLKLYQMDKLCKALYCTPNDLLEWNDPAGDPSHPLTQLTRDQDSIKSMDLLEKLPVDKLSQLKGVLDEMMKED